MGNLITTAALASLVLSTMVGNSASAQNPIVGGSASSSISYDPFSDHTYIDNSRNTVRQSYLDANRNRVDPGSFKYVDRYFVDNMGRTVHEFGPTWTSFGKPHGNLTRETVTTYYPTPRYQAGGCSNGGFLPGGGTTIRDQGTVLYSRPMPGGSVTGRNSGTVLYSKKVPQRGGVTKRNRDNVSFLVAPPEPRGGSTKRIRKHIQFRRK